MTTTALEATAAQVNEFQMFLSFKMTWICQQFLLSDHQLLALFTGNQLGKNAIISRGYVMRILGLHPIPHKNVLYFECGQGHESTIMTRPKDNRCPTCSEEVREHLRGSRIFRFASETLPAEKEDVSDKGASAEIMNSQYPEFKKWLPRNLIKKDITFRNPKMTLYDPNGGADIVVEFVSYNQTVQRQAGVQRLSTWCIAEGQRVLMSDGVWRNIEQMKRGDEVVCEALGGHGTRQRTNRIKEVFSKGEKEVVRVVCHKGIEFEATPEHLIMVPGLGKAQYKPLSQLQPGDRVNCTFSSLIGVDTLEDWHLAAIGILLGDGCVTGKTPKFTSKYPRLAKELGNLLPPSLSITKKEMRTRSVNDYFIVKSKFVKSQENPMKRVLVNLGLWGKYAKEKFVPDVFFRQSDRAIAMFLGYLYATDGCASGHTIGYYSTSHRLAQDVFLLLRRLGIRASVSKKTFTNRWNDQWWVMVTASRDVLNFIEKIHVVGKEEAVSKLKHEAIRRMKSSKRRCIFDKHPDVIKEKISRSVTIRSIESLGMKPVYDLSMEKGGWDYRITRGHRKLRNIARTKRNNFLINGGVVVHNCDEEPPLAFFQEQIPRLLSENGDLILSLTPAQHMTWTYDGIYERADIYYRTQAVAEFTGRPEIEHSDSPLSQSVAVFCAATDDNPTLDTAVIEKMFEHFDDPDVVAIRRYGVHKQISGRIFKEFDALAHVIHPEKYFQEVA